MGATGDVSVLSFQYHKLVTAGEGGLVLTDDQDLYERAYRFHDLGMFRRAGAPDPAGLDTMLTIGLNLRMSEIHAALLLAQFQRIPPNSVAVEGSLPSSAAGPGFLLRAVLLAERRLIEQTERNHAFLCLSAPTAQDASMAARSMAAQGVPAQQCGRVDAHHFRAWEAYLKRDDRRYRMVASKKDSDLLDRTLFVEINAESGQSDSV